MVKLTSSSDLQRYRLTVVQNQDKYVVLNPGDNLGKTAKQHGITVADIVKWNGIRDVRQIGAGARLIVRKGEPATS